MADHPDNLDDDLDQDAIVPGDEAGGSEPEDVTYGREDAGETPRRAASAEFVVESAVGSQAMLREAMDPANQSLAEALRLSFRVLQVVILILVILFVFSGAQTVKEGQSGVLLRWGKILTVGGTKALEPGLKFSRWPYPAGEFVLFQAKGRQADVGNAFWPNLGNENFQRAVETASVNQRLRPGRDGAVLTRGGDIAHMQLAAQYDIEFPERFVYAVEDENDDPRRLDAQRLVELALERAVVHVAARRTLQDFIDLAGDGKPELIDQAQSLLDGVDSGINLTSVDTPIDPTPALAIKRAYGELQEAKVRATEAIENARQGARNALLEMAGYRYNDIIELIGAYERQHALGDAEQAEMQLEKINEALESEDTSGTVAAILSQARSYRSTVDATLGQEARRFASTLEKYRQHPDLVIKQLWSETVARVMARDDVEIIVWPDEGGVLDIAIAGRDHIREIRRENSVRIRDLESMLQGLDLENQYILRGREMREGPGRQLTESAESLK